MQSVQVTPRERGRWRRREGEAYINAVLADVARRERDGDDMVQMLASLGDMQFLRPQDVVGAMLPWDVPQGVERISDPGVRHGVGSRDPFMQKRIPPPAPSLPPAPVNPRIAARTYRETHPETVATIRAFLAGATNVGRYGRDLAAVAWGDGYALVEHTGLPLAYRDLNGVVTCAEHEHTPESACFLEMFVETFHAAGTPAKE